MQHALSRQLAPRATRLLLARGTRAAEELLVAQIEALLPPGRLDPRVLAAPVRLVVPGRALRQHLSRVLCRVRGGALVGLSLHTLHGLALEILDRAGADSPGSASVFDVMVRRAAREEPALREALEPLVDGYASAVGAVRDLLDAGLDEALVEGLEERIEAMSGTLTASERARAAALVRVAAAVDADMTAHGLGRTGALFRSALALLERDPDRALPSRAVLVYGFANTTGVALDFMEGLCRSRPGVVLIDQPPDPVDPDQLDLGASWSSRLLMRMSMIALPEEDERWESPGPDIKRFRAAGATEEVREVAHRARDLLDRGVAPEDIAIVARDLHGYRIPLRTHLRRLGVPFSGVGALGPPGGMGRRVHAMLELLRKREDTAADRWLDALGPRGRVGRRPQDTLRWRPVPLFDLRLALKALGAVKLHHVATLDLGRVLDGRERMPLPVRRGLWEAPEEAPETGSARASARRRSLDGGILRSARQSAEELRARWAEWPERTSLTEHLTWLRRLLREDLGWDQQYVGMNPVFGALGALEREFPRAFSMRYDEFALVVARALYDIGAEPIGGAGGGVQVLEATEARGLTFPHLFLLGMNRDVFPRTASDDPMLPDAVRRGLRELLPDLPVRQEGFDEERALFAGLLSASPRVTLSWQVVDDDGKARPPSPLVERLRWARGVDEAELIKPIYSLAPGLRLLPVGDHALLVALHGPREALSAMMPLALREAAGDLLSEGDQAHALGAVRQAVLDEMDPDRSTREGRGRASDLGPYYGFIGGMGLADLRQNELYITTVERMSGCPWQVFLERLLRLESPPDPTASLPGVDALMLGHVVHGVLQRVVGETMPHVPALADALLQAAQLVSWPDPERLEILLLEESQRVLNDAGLGLQGFARALAAQARPYLDGAREQDWLEPVSVVGYEIEGRVSVDDDQGRPREIRFKVDRIDRGSAGELRFTDYKTGGPPSTSKKDDTRRRKLLGSVREGTTLQAAAYAASGGEGRYLYLKPEVERRDLSVATDDLDFAAAFQSATRTALRAWDQGSFFPRLVEPDKNEEPDRCARCGVAQACLRGDSGARGRMTRWADGARRRAELGEPLTADEAAVLGVWTLSASPESVPDAPPEDKA